MFPVYTFISRSGRTMLCLSMLWTCWGGPVMVSGRAATYQDPDEQAAYQAWVRDHFSTHEQKDRTIKALWPLMGYEMQVFDRMFDEQDQRLPILTRKDITCWSAICDAHRQIEERPRLLLWLDVVATWKVPTLLKHVRRSGYQEEPARVCYQLLEKQCFGETVEALKQAFEQPEDHGSMHEVYKQEPTATRQLELTTSCAGVGVRHVPKPKKQKGTAAKEGEPSPTPPSSSQSSHQGASSPSAALPFDLWQNLTILPTSRQWVIGGLVITVLVAGCVKTYQSFQQR